LGHLAERMSELRAERRAAGPKERARLRPLIVEIRANLESVSTRQLLLNAHDAELAAKARSLQSRLDRVLRDMRAMQPGGNTQSP
jgi:hypothetical protein